MSYQIIYLFPIECAPRVFSTLLNDFHDCVVLLSNSYKDIIHTIVTRLSSVFIVLYCELRFSFSSNCTEIISLYYVRDTYCIEAST
jgi:hypothetical protein